MRSPLHNQVLEVLVDGRGMVESCTIVKDSE